jgi:hypothetical protein
MVSHEATEIPHTHHEDSEEAGSGSDLESMHSKAEQRRARQEEPTIKRLEHEVEYALEESVEAATGRGMASRPSLDKEDAEGTTALDKRSSGDDSHEDHDLEAQDAENPSGKKKGRKEVELQDQTNLLPVRQVIVVFMGLSAALFVSLLDQTM